MATTWASSNPHSPELLVCPPADTPGLTPQYRYVFVVPKVRHFYKAGIVAGKENARRMKGEIDRKNLRTRNRKLRN
jgi:hypothetical protein